MPIKFPCSVCKKSVAKNQKAVLCELCNRWSHAKCNNISKEEYDRLIDEVDDIPWACLHCINDAMPFGWESNESLYLTMTKGSNFLKADLQNINICLDKDKKIQ